MTEQVGQTDQAMLLLIRELSGGMASLREAGTKQADDTHAVRLALAEIKASLAPLARVSTDQQEMKTKLALCESKLREFDDVEKRVTALEQANSQRSGWEGFGGKLLYLLGGALLTTIIGAGIALLMSNPARASGARLDPIANAKCMAAPAKPRPKYLFV